MFRVFRIRREFFVLLSFITVVLLVWNGIHKDLSNRTQAVFGKDLRVRKAATVAHRQAPYTAREISSKLTASRVKKTNMEKIGTLMKDPSNYLPRNDYVKSRDKGIGTDYQNPSGAEMGKTLKHSTESTFNQHSTKSGTILASSDLKPTLSTTSPHPPKRQTVDITKQPARKSVYGELDCPDNPWREDLFELLHAWYNISKQNHIEYVLAFGSLLGAMRDGDVIPYDSDIDILLDINYFSTLKRLSVRRNFRNSDEKIRLVVQPEFTFNIRVDERKRFDCKGKKAKIMVDGCAFQEPMARLLKGNLHIDIFHFYDRVHTVDEPSDDRRKEYDKKDFYPFQSCNFMGLKVSCPNNPWEILRVYFNTDDLEPIYKCKNGSWVDKEGARVDVS